jgi:hypothetical protein
MTLLQCVHNPNFDYTYAYPEETIPPSLGPNLGTNSAMHRTTPNTGDLCQRRLPNLSSNWITTDSRHQQQPPRAYNLTTTTTCQIPGSPLHTKAWGRGKWPSPPWVPAAFVVLVARPPSILISSSPLILVDFLPTHFGHLVVPAHCSICRLLILVDLLPSCFARSSPSFLI